MLRSLTPRVRFIWLSRMECGSVLKKRTVSPGMIRIRRSPGWRSTVCSRLSAVQSHGRCRSGSRTPASKSSPLWRVSCGRSSRLFPKTNSIVRNTRCRGAAEGARCGGERAKPPAVRDREVLDRAVLSESSSLRRQTIRGFPAAVDPENTKKKEADNATRKWNRALRNGADDRTCSGILRGQRTGWVYELGDTAQRFLRSRSRQERHRVRTRRFRTRMPEYVFCDGTTGLDEVGQSSPTCNLGCDGDGEAGAEKTCRNVAGGTE